VIGPLKKYMRVPEWLNAQEPIGVPTEQVDEIILARISQFKTANQVLALVKKKVAKTPVQFDQEFTLVLDGIQDPGNFGAIIRTADWFGVKQMLVSEDNAGLYNPKVIQSTMGSFLRVNVTQCNIETVLTNTKLPVYGAVLSGDAACKNKNAGPLFFSDWK